MMSFCHDVILHVPVIGSMTQRNFYSILRKLGNQKGSDKKQKLLSLKKKTMDDLSSLEADLQLV